jgi:hypothetical protein
LVRADRSTYNDVGCVVGLGTEMDLNHSGEVIAEQEQGSAFLSGDLDRALVDRRR